MIIGKGHAELLIYDADGILRGAALALLDVARGKDSTPGLGPTVEVLETTVRILTPPKCV